MQSSTPRIDAVLSEIRLAFRSAGLRKCVLAEKACVHANTLRHMEDPDWNPSLATVRRLERALLPIAEAASLHIGSRSV